MPGEALRLLFSGKVDTAALSSQLMVYEVDGGRLAVVFEDLRRGGWYRQRD